MNTTMFPKILIMSTNEQTPLSQPTFAVRNTLEKEQISQDMGMPASDAAPTPNQEHQAEGGTSERGSDLDVSAACPKVLSQCATNPSHQGRKIRKEKRCLKGWKMVYSTGLETRRRVCPHTRMTQDVSCTIAVAEILRAVTRAPALEEQSLPMRNIITKERPHIGRKLCQKAKVAQEDTESQGQKSKGQALRMTIYPSHGYVRKLIRSLPAFVILISQEGPTCQVTLKHMTEARIQKITSRSFRQQQKWNVGQCQHGATCLTPHLPDLPGKSASKILWKSTISSREKESTKDFVGRFKVESRDVKGVPEIIRISGFMHGITNPELIKRLHDKIPKSVDEMMRITTSFLRGEVAAGNQERKKSLPPWKQQEDRHKQNFKKGGFKNQQRLE
ncbi:hypothetical protein Tco_1106401 [Tanacetum coccineum]